jgi:hypothetical protein
MQQYTEVNEQDGIHPDAVGVMIAHSYPYTVFVPFIGNQVNGEPILTQSMYRAAAFQLESQLSQDGPRYSELLSQVRLGPGF